VEQIGVQKVKEVHDKVDKIFQWPCQKHTPRVKARLTAFSNFSRMWRGVLAGGFWLTYVGRSISSGALAIVVDETEDDERRLPIQKQVGSATNIFRVIEIRLSYTARHLIASFAPSPGQSRPGFLINGATQIMSRRHIDSLHDH
jgi:hypothetical protein